MQLQQRRFVGREADRSDVAGVAVGVVVPVTPALGVPVVVCVGDVVAVVVAVRLGVGVGVTVTVTVLVLLGVGVGVSVASGVPTGFKGDFASGVAAVVASGVGVIPTCAASTSSACEAG